MSGRIEVREGDGKVLQLIVKDASNDNPFDDLGCRVPK